MRNISMLILASALCLQASAQSLRNQNRQHPLKIEKNNITYNADERGNRIIDYSFCGYKMSSKAIPDVPVVVSVANNGGDQSKRIQAAIDYVSALKPDKATGLRGAVLLGEGVFKINNPLRISASGVVLRGVSEHSTVIRKTGVDRGAVVYIEGRNDMKITDTLRLTDDYVALGKKLINLDDAKGIAAGDRLVIVRPSTKEWIQSIGCDVFGGGLGYWGWKPGEMDVRWERTVTSVNGNGINIDAPLTIALDKQWGGAYALKYSWPGRIHDSGVENLTIESIFNSAADEDHAWDGVYIDSAEDCWVRMINFRNLAGSAVAVQRYAQQVTVADCKSLAPQSEIGGLRRRTFLTLGGKCLFIRCYSSEGINDFSAGYCAPGPNAFVQCDADNSHGFSGSSSSWATGLLFDNVNINNGSLSFKNLELDKWGAGWNTANSLFWQCTASRIDCYDASEDARCYAIGCWAYCVGDGYWTSTNDHVNPHSFFEYQLSERTNADFALQQCRTLVRNTDASSSPTVDKAMEMASEALKPRLTLEQWIDSAVFTSPVDAKAKGVIAVEKIMKDPRDEAIEATASLSIQHSHFVLNTEAVGKKNSTVTTTILSGNLHRTPWWNGRTRFPYMDKADYAVTRFVPGMEQRGGTDRLDSVINNIERQNISIWNQNYGLWYDRRRDDHERVNRADGDVWAPFWEQVFKRSGEGKAWDGLSKYDLSKLSPWYIHRVHTLADIRPSMLVINQHYFQHNILEAGAHWVDSPWRTVNNINDTQFLEPVPFTGDKRIFTAEAFYDTSHPKRSELHRLYIHNMLDAFADCPNVYHSVSEEFTGPLQFTQFWIDCIGQWQQLRGRDANVVLNTTRDVMNSVMSDKKRADVIDAVVIEQWYYAGGTPFTPEGGKNLAPRQHMRLQRTGQTGFHDVYRAVAEVTKDYPETPVIYIAKAFDRNPWAVILAGGSCPAIALENEALANALITMCPVYADDLTVEPSLYLLVSEKHDMLLAYNASDKAVAIPGNLLAEGHKYIISTIDKRNGKVIKTLNAGTTDIPAGEIVWIK